MGIIEGPFDRDKFKHVKMQDDELVLVACPKDSLALKGFAEIDDIVFGGRLILRERGSGTRVVFENRLLEMGYNPTQVKVYMEIGSIGAIKSLVEAGLGYTVISRAAVAREAEAGTLVIVPIRNLTILREFNFIYTDKNPGEFVEDFISFIATQK